MHYPIRILVAFSALWTFCTAFILDYRGFDVRTPLVQKGCKGSPSDDIHPVMDFSISPSVSISIRRRFLAPSTLFSSSTSELDIPSDMEEEMRVDVVNARNRLLMETKNLVENSITGLFLTIPSDRFAFQKLVTQLEVLAPATFTQRDLLQCIGDWELLCTSRGPTVSSSKEETKSSQSLPFSLPKPPDSVRKSISVVQRIVAENDSNIINRIDHIIEYTPLSLQQLIPEESPLKIIRDLNINPLEVSRTKLTLVHNAQVESLTPVFRTKISLKNVTVNVAGTSQFLNPQGAEILGLNVPSLGDFLNAGSFDTTYVDDKVRISRGTIGFLNEIRVFVRKGWSVDTILSEE